jgi:uncharacterized protein
VSAEPFYILAIDGGGIRGVFPAHILKCIQSRLKVSLLRKFGMISGTSTGAIVAAAVALDIDLEKVIALYREHGEAIFKRRRFWGPTRFEPAIRSRYEKNALKSVLNEVLGEKTLGQITIPLLLPATDIGNGGVHVFKSNYSSEFTRDSSVLLKDAVLASCSAPTYFDPTTVNEYLLADGGLWANNPSLAAVIDAQKRLGIKIEDVRVLSIGTGHSRTCYGVTEDRKWGFVNGWKGPEFIDFLMSLQAQSTHNYLQLLLSDSQFIRLNFESDCPLPLDDCSAIRDLISNADRVFTHNSQRISTFLNI